MTRRKSNSVTFVTYLTFVYRVFVADPGHQSTKRNLELLCQNYSTFLLVFAICLHDKMITILKAKNVVKCRPKQRKIINCIFSVVIYGHSLMRQMQSVAYATFRNGA